MEFPKLNLQEFEKSKGAQRQKLSVQLDNICRNTTFTHVSISIWTEPLLVCGPLSGAL